MQRGAALASGVSQQAVEEEAGIRIAGVIPARIAPTGKIPFGRASFGNQVLNGHRLLGRPVRVKRGLEVPRLRLRHRITDAIGASRRSRWQLDARGSLWFTISVVGFIGHALWRNSLRRCSAFPPRRSAFRPSLPGRTPAVLQPAGASWQSGGVNGGWSNHFVRLPSTPYFSQERVLRS